MPLYSELCGFRTYSVTTKTCSLPLYYLTVDIFVKTSSLTTQGKFDVWSQNMKQVSHKEKMSMDHFEQLGTSKLANTSACRHECQGYTFRKEYWLK